jgi:hypothetical protein
MKMIEDLNSIGKLIYFEGMDRIIISQDFFSKISKELDRVGKNKIFDILNDLMDEEIGEEMKKEIEEMSNNEEEMKETMKYPQILPKLHSILQKISSKNKNLNEMKLMKRIFLFDGEVVAHSSSNIIDNFDLTSSTENLLKKKNIFIPQMKVSTQEKQKYLSPFFFSSQKPPLNLIYLSNGVNIEKFIKKNTTILNIFLPFIPPVTNKKYFIL